MTTPRTFNFGSVCEQMEAMLQLARGIQLAGRAIEDDGWVIDDLAMRMQADLRRLRKELGLPE